MTKQKAVSLLMRLEVLINRSHLLDVLRFAKDDYRYWKRGSMMKVETDKKILKIRTLLARYGNN